MNDKTPRVPTIEEKNEVVEWLLANDDAWHDPKREDEVREDLKGLIDGAYIAVFDKYSTGGPGYVGKVMTVVWDGGPHQTETYSWHPVTKKIERDVEVHEE